MAVGSTRFWTVIIGLIESVAKRARKWPDRIEGGTGNAELLISFF
jgi:hypothetical protein